MIKKNVFFISGNQYDVNKSLSEVLKKFDGWRQFRMNGEQHKSSDVYSRLAEKNVLGDNGRVVIFRYLPEDYANLIDIIENLSDKRALVIISPFNFKMFGHQVRAENSKLIQSIKEHGHVFNFAIEATPARAKPWVESLLKEEFKLKISSDAFNELFERCNNNLDHLFSEVKKLSQFVFPKRSIELDDVDSCVIDLKETNIWNWVDSLLTMDSARVLYELEELFTKSDLETEQLMAIMLQKVETTLFIREHCSQLSYKCISDILSEFKKNSKTGVVQKYSQPYINQMANAPTVKDAVQKNGVVKLVNCLNIIYSLKVLAREVSNETFKKTVLTLCSLLVSDFQYASLINSFAEAE